VKLHDDAEQVGVNAAVGGWLFGVVGGPSVKLPSAARAKFAVSWVAVAATSSEPHVGLALSAENAAK
jgi:hypothetical protein